MNTGIDGMVIDAVNWYTGCNWEICRRSMTGLIAALGGTFCQPEGAGGFGDDPVAWVTEGGWTCIQDYGLGIWWEKDNQPLVDAMARENPQGLEKALCGYHDRVSQAGAILYLGADVRFNTPDEWRLYCAFVIAVGGLLCENVRQGSLDALDEERGRLLKLRASHPALHPAASRIPVVHDGNGACLAWLKTDVKGSEKLLVLLNFSSSSARCTFDSAALSATSLTDLLSGASVDTTDPWTAPIEPRGYVFLQVR
jgi:hypothetical protein